MKNPNQKKNDNCPVCQSSILHFEGDQFCVDCDWNTMLADVESGQFERCLGLIKPKPQSSVVLIEADMPEMDHKDFVTISAS